MIYADRVQETTTTTGTGSITLGGAVAAFRTFAAALTSGDEVTYCIAGTTEWEVGRGTFTAPSTLSRAEVYASSNSGAAVSFSAGTKRVFVTQSAETVTDAAALAAEAATRAAADTALSGRVDTLEAGSATTITGPAVLGKLTAGSGAVVEVPVSQAGAASSIVATDASSRLVGVQALVVGSDERVRVSATGVEIGGSLKTTGSTASGAQSVALGSVCTASGPQAIAMGNDCIASGDRAVAIGYNVDATKTYGVAIGSNLSNIGVAAVQCGENLSNSDDSANCSQIGFQQTIGTNSPYASAIGCYVNIEANNTGALVCGYNAAVVTGRPGSFQHSSGCTGYAGTGWIDMMRLCTAAPAALQNVQGGAFFAEFYSFGLYTIEVIGCTDDAVKVAHEIIKIPGTRGTGNITLGTPVVESGSTMAAAGWSVTISAEASGELRITCNPGTDTVRFGARVSWSRIGATYSVV